MQKCNSGYKVAFLNAQTTDVGWDPKRLVILGLKPLL